MLRVLNSFACNASNSFVTFLLMPSMSSNLICSYVLFLCRGSDVYIFWMFLVSYVFVADVHALQNM
jgi:hypothetical protein